MGAARFDGPAAMRAFAWRVLRLMPLSEQLLALRRRRDVTSMADAVEILAAAGDASRPFLAQVAPALADQIAPCRRRRASARGGAGSPAPGPTAASCPSRRYWTMLVITDQEGMPCESLRLASCPAP